VTTAFPKPRVASLVCGVVGLVVVNTLPVLLGVLKSHLGLSATQLGSFGSAETIGLALGTLAAVFALRRCSPRAVAAVGLGLACAADLASLWLPSIAELNAARWVGGFGTGFTQAACFLVYGESHREQNQAIYSIGQTGLAFLVIWVLPLVVSLFGWRSMFPGLAVLMVPALLMVRYFPSRPMQSAVQDAPRGRVPLSVPIWFALAGVSLFYVGQGSLWAFLETIGDASGFPADTVHTAMTVCAAFGTLGPVVVLLMAERIKPAGPLIGSVAVTLVAVSFMQSRSPWIYCAAISAFFFCLSVFAAYQFGVIAGAERSGRAAVLMSTANYGGFSVSAWVGGQLVEHFGYTSLALFDGSMMITALATLLWVIRLGSDVEPPQTSVRGTASSQVRLVT
jgi:MFS transporter, DHA1 family, inner membrane transport protein